MYSSYSFSISALDGTEWSMSFVSHALPLGKVPLVPIGQEDWLGPSAGLDAEARRKSSAPVGDCAAIVQPVVSHCTD